MSRFLIKSGLPFYLSGLAGKGDMFSSDYLCNLHTIVTIAHIWSQFTHFCCNFLQVCRNLRTFVVVPENLRFTHLGAKKTVNLGFRAKKTEFPAMSSKPVPHWALPLPQPIPDIDTTPTRSQLREPLWPSEYF